MVLSHQLDLLCALDGLLKLWTSFSPSGNCDCRKCNDFLFFLMLGYVRILVVVRFRHSTQTSSSTIGSYRSCDWEAWAGLDRVHRQPLAVRGSHPANLPPSGKGAAPSHGLQLESGSRCSLVLTDLACPPCRGMFCAEWPGPVFLP